MCVSTNNNDAKICRGDLTAYSALTLYCGFQFARVEPIPGFTASNFKLVFTGSQRIDGVVKIVGRIFLRRKETERIINTKRPITTAATTGVRRGRRGRQNTPQQPATPRHPSAEVYICKISTSKY